MNCSSFNASTSDTLDSIWNHLFEETYGGWFWTLRSFVSARATEQIIATFSSFEFLYCRMQQIETKTLYVKRRAWYTCWLFRFARGFTLLSSLKIFKMFVFRSVARAYKRQVPWIHAVVRAKLELRNFKKWGILKGKRKYMYTSFRYFNRKTKIMRLLPLTGKRM